MSSKIPQEIHNLVPEELRDNYGIYWSARSNRYYVYRDLGYVYDTLLQGRAHELLHIHYPAHGQHS